MHSLFFAVLILIAYNYIAFSTSCPLSNIPQHPYAGVVPFPIYSGNEAGTNRLTIYTIHSHLDLEKGAYCNFTFISMT